MIDYLKGVCFIVAAISWCLVFNYGWYCSTGDNMWKRDIVVAFVLPFLIPMAVAVLLILPWLIGREM